jgi:hypothetical protein
MPLIVASGVPTGRLSAAGPSSISRASSTSSNRTVEPGAAWPRRARLDQKSSKSIYDTPPLAAPRQVAPVFRLLPPACPSGSIPGCRQRCRRARCAIGRRNHASRSRRAVLNSKVAGMDGNRTHPGRLSSAPQTVLKTAGGTSPRSSPAGRDAIRSGEYRRPRHQEVEHGG